MICAVFLGPWYGVAVAFAASLLRNLLGMGSLMAFPGSMCGALLCGMDRFIATELDMPVLLAKEPMDCAALGIGQLAEDLELLQRMCQSAPQRDDEEETTF